MLRTVDVPGLKKWSYNDDINYFDGVNLWLTTRDPDTLDLGVIALNLDTLEVTKSFTLGNGDFNIFIGKATRDGTLLVGMRNLGTVVAIDTNALEVLWTKEVPTNEGVVCDADISVGTDGVERFAYPTREGETVVTLDPKTGETLAVADLAEGSLGSMLTVAPDGNIWVRESRTFTNAVFNPVNLDLLARVNSGGKYGLGTFSPDGKLAYLFSGDTKFTVVDTETFRVLNAVEVGANVSRIAPHPNGELLYVKVSKENRVAVVDTSTWRETASINLDPVPGSLFVRAR